MHLGVALKPPPHKPGRPVLSAAGTKREHQRVLARLRRHGSDPLMTIRRKIASPDWSARQFEDALRSGFRQVAA